MTLQEQFELNHQLNLDGKMTHDEFFLWLADAIHITVGNLPVSLDVIRNSTDKHLNDIPLIKWDQCDSLVRSKAGYAGIRSWSLSDTVCTLKCFARRAAKL